MRSNEKKKSEESQGCRLVIEQRGRRRKGRESERGEQE
jgi:hypothetical protein